MDSNKHQQAAEIKYGDLREKAKKLLAEQGSQLRNSEKPLAELVEELRLHQVELELQNQELLEAQEHLEASRLKYFHLFDLAPIGYAVLNSEGIIYDLNLKAAEMLGRNRSQLTAGRFSMFAAIKQDSFNNFRQHLFRVFHEDKPHSCTVSFINPEKKETTVAKLLSTAIDDEKMGKVCFLSMTDITELTLTEQALKKSERRFRELFEHQSSGIIIIELLDNNKGFHIKDINSSGCNILNRSSELLVDHKLTEVLTGFQEHKFISTLQRVWNNSEPEEFASQNYRDQHTEFWADYRVFKLPSGELALVFDDITEKKAYADQLKLMSMKDQLTGIYNRTYFEEELKRYTSSRDYPITIISADVDGLKLINDTMGHDKGDKVLRASAKVLQDSLRKSDILARTGGDEFTALLPFTDKKTGEIIVSRIKDKITKYNNEHDDLPLSISIGVGTAKSQSKDLNEVLKEADDLMYRDKLYRSLSTRSHVVQALLATLAERDFITEGHTQRLAEICKKIGQKAGLTSSQLSDLYLLTQVHDLGKVGIPDSMLFKKGPLTDEEWDIMRLHPEKGYRIAMSSPDLSGVADLILKHHERFDGNGYPLGIEGHNIPIECRILAVVDAFDAMTNERPYNTVKTKSEAIKELEINSGSQFDPSVVKYFLEVINETKC